MPESRPFLSYSEASELLEATQGFIDKTAATTMQLVRGLELMRPLISPGAYEREKRLIAFQNDFNTQCLGRSYSELCRAPGVLVINHAVTDEQAFLQGVGIEEESGQYQALVQQSADGYSQWPILYGAQLALIGGAHSVIPIATGPRRQLRITPEGNLRPIVPQTFYQRRPA